MQQKKVFRIEAQKGTPKNFRLRYKPFSQDTTTPWKEETYHDELISVPKDLPNRCNVIMKKVEL
jgi:hypothetical protein